MWIRDILPVSDRKDGLGGGSPPDFCLVDVTQETFLAGGMLCGKRYADIEAGLDRFGYRKIIR